MHLSIDESCMYRDLHVLPLFYMQKPLQQVNPFKFPFAMPNSQRYVHSTTLQQYALSMSTNPH